MERISWLRSFGRLASGAAIGMALVLGAARPAFGTFFASSQLCYGADCSEMGYDAPLASVSDIFHRDVYSGVPNQTGYFDENATAGVAARQVTFEVGFLGGELTPDVFLGSTPSRPYGSLTLIAFMGAIGEDALTITAPGLVTGFVSLDISLQAGGVDGCTAVGGCSTGLPFVSPDLQVQFFAQAGGQSASDQLLDNAQLAVPGGFSQQYTSSQIPFVAATPFSIRLGISGTMALRALLDPTPPELFLSGGTLGATATVERVHVFDANHDPVASVSISSATGADWTTTVPEASAVASGLAVAAALGLLAVQRRIRAVRDRLDRHETA
jgi:hypothetical protein